MIKKEDVKFLYKQYYVPSYNGIDAVTILKLVNDYEAYVKGRNYTYNIPLAHMYKTKDEALQGKSHLLICTKQKMKHYKENPTCSYVQNKR